VFNEYVVDNESVINMIIMIRF